MGTRDGTLSGRIFPTLLGVVPLFLAMIAAPAAGAPSYCNDPEAVARWENLSRSNPQDYGIQTLDALRIGLCQKVEQRTLSELEMLEIFWASRSKLIAQGVSRRMESFLKKEEDRERRRQLVEAKVERLREDYEALSSEHQAVVSEIRELNWEVREEEERYQRRCDDPSLASDRRCQRSREGINDLREEISDLQEEAESVWVRQRDAYQDYIDARSALGQ